MFSVVFITFGKIPQKIKKVKKSTSVFPVFNLKGTMKPSSTKSGGPNMKNQTAAAISDQEQQPSGRGYQGRTGKAINCQSLHRSTSQSPTTSRSPAPPAPPAPRLHPCPQTRACTAVHQPLLCSAHTCTIFRCILTLSGFHQRTFLQILLFGLCVFCPSVPGHSAVGREKIIQRGWISFSFSSGGRRANT